MRFVAENTEKFAAVVSIKNGDELAPDDVDIHINGELVAYFSAKHKCLVVLELAGTDLEEEFLEELDTDNGFIAVYQHDESFNV